MSIHIKSEIESIFNIYIKLSVKALYLYDTMVWYRGSFDERMYIMCYNVYNAYN